MGSSLIKTIVSYIFEKCKQLFAFSADFLEKSVHKCVPKSLTFIHGYLTTLFETAV